uniref:Putative type III restriction enzyme n=1 Tax=viral metagenome TaxID=1070528 RepID=A0A6H1Z8Z6_9ZZZZ
MELRPYQRKAITEVQQAWSQGSRAVCLVAPTGSGKTVMGAALVIPDRTLWIVHRLELRDQAMARVPGARVETVQGLLASGERPDAELLILDECHHYAAIEWKTLAEHYSSARVLGLTATPQRRDGATLGDIFQHLVVAAQYSELTEAGYLVKCVTYRPDRQLGSNELAQDPIKAYQRWGEGGQGFAYVNRVTRAAELAADFTEAGIPADYIVGDMPTMDRADSWQAFLAGGTKMLTNVYVLTEGVDHPPASVCLLARGCQHYSTYLQMVGRVLRPSPGKERAILIDLQGMSHEHGLPGEDIIYSLTGRAMISRDAPLKTCPECGATIYSSVNPCPECGYVWEVQPAPPSKIWDMDLQAVYAGANTPGTAKRREWTRLMDLCRLRAWDMSWGAKEYGKLFPDETPPATYEEKRMLYNQLLIFAGSKGWKSGWAAHRYRGIFGVWPQRQNG